MTTGRDTLTDEQRARWSTVLAHLVAAVPAGSPSVLVDGATGGAALLADRLVTALREAGRVGVRVTDAAHADGRPDFVVRVRTVREHHHDDAHVVVDLQDPAWPVIRHIDGRFAPHGSWYRGETRAFFGARAGTWNTRFGDDLPAYAAAVADAGIDGGVAVDVGCGTGRALPALRTAVGPEGTVIGVDLTPQMLAAARDSATAGDALLVLADARHLPLATASVDAVFAAGLLTHLPDSDAGLRELARVARPGGLLVLFHPSGRAALAARHGRTLRPDEPLAETPLRLAAERTGWTLTTYDDAPHRFLAVAVRR